MQFWTNRLKLFKEIFCSENKKVKEILLKSKKFMNFLFMFFRCKVKVLSSN